MSRHAERLSAFSTVSSALALLSDTRLSALLDDAQSLGSGFGGRTFRAEVADLPVFAKRVPLTDLERLAENVMSTANHFDLPMYYQYGVGSTGFGAWRELAVHTMTTNWVLTDQSQGFPLTYHWRVLPDPEPQPPTSAAREELDRAVAYWGDSPAVRARLEAIGRSTASLVLFLEYIPQTVDAWLADQVPRGAAALDAACAMVHRGLREEVAFMRSRGLVHFDAHFHNVLTDGHRLYFADYGLAGHSAFELSAEESRFLHEHRDYDRALTETQLVNWLVGALYPNADRSALVREFADGRDPGCDSAVAAEIIGRDAPVAAVVNEFFRVLVEETKTAPYPADALRCARDPWTARSGRPRVVTGREWSTQPAGVELSGLGPHRSE